MSDQPKIECAKNGPLLATGLPRLERLDGTQFETKKVTALCRCGKSAVKPFCDGAHSRTGFDDAKGDGLPADEQVSYTGQGIMLHDNRRVCAHAGFCTERLPTVFRQKEEPWIDADGASVEDIIALVRACPSGALSYTIDGVEHRDNEDAAQAVKVVPGGPYVVQGGVDLAGVEFGQGASREHFDLCRCGASKNKPFCDGAHWYENFDADVPREPRA